MVGALWLYGSRETGTGEKVLGSAGRDGKLGGEKDSSFSGRIRIFVLGMILFPCLKNI